MIKLCLVGFLLAFEWASSSLGKLEAGEAFISALKLFRLGSYREAAAQFERVSEGELSDDALYLAGWSHILLGDEEGGKKAFGKLIDLYPDSPFSGEAGAYLHGPGERAYGEAYFSSGWMSFSKGDYIAAFVSFLEFVKRSPESPLAPLAEFKMGESLFQLGFFDGAAERFRNFLRLSPGHRAADMAHFQLGICYEKGGRYDEAVDEFWKVVREFPESSMGAESFFHLGKNYFQIGRYYAALSALQKFLSLADSTSQNVDEGRLYLERAYFRTGRYKSEMDIAVNFVKKYPESPLAGKLQLEIGNYYNEGYRFEEAIEAYRKVLSRPEWSRYFIDAEMAIAKASSRLGGDKGIRLLTGLIDSTSHSEVKGIALVERGKLFYRERKYDLAIADYGAVLSLNVDREAYVEALMGLAECYEALSAWEEAANAYRRIAERYGDVADLGPVYLKLSSSYRRIGLLEESIEAANRAIPHLSDRERAEAQLSIGDMYFELGDLPESEKAYLSVLEQCDGSDEEAGRALFGIGRVALESGDMEKALSAFRRVAEGDAPEELRRTARDIVEELEGKLSSH